MKQFARYLPIVSVAALVLAFVLLITAVLVARSVQFSAQAADPAESVTVADGGDELSAEQIEAIETANAQVLAAAQATAEASGEAAAIEEATEEEDSAETVVDNSADELSAEEEFDPNAPRTINAPYTIYKNTLTRGWENRTFDGNVNFNGFPAYDGLTAMTMSFSAEDGAIYLYTPTPIDVEPYNVLRFFVNGGSAGSQQIAVALVDENEEVLTQVPLTPPYPNNWRQIDISLEELGNPSAIHGVQFVDIMGCCSTHLLC